MAAWMILATAGLAAGPAAAQSADCAALKARIEAAGPTVDAGRLASEIGRNRDELGRVEAYAADSGCTGNSLFGDPDSPECHALARRAEELGRTLQRLAGAAAQDGDEDRRAAIEDYNAVCGGEAGAPAPDGVIPVDPDAPAAPAEAPAPTGRVAKVFCVRRCDGAFYPLAVDVPTGSLDAMNRLCGAQCPNAEASAFVGSGDDIAQAHALDGATYAALPTAFAFQKSTLPTCSCRAPGASWAQTLAKAETMIAVHKGDVVVTPEVQARMLLPQPVLDTKPAAAKPVAAKRVAPARQRTPPAVEADTAAPGADVMRELRRSAPTL